MAVVSCTTTRPFLVGCVGCMDMPEEEEFNLRQIKGGCQSESIYTNTVLHVRMFGQNIFCLALIKSCVMESCACTCILTKRFHLILQSLHFWSMGTLCVCVACVHVCMYVCVCVCVHLCVCVCVQCFQDMLLVSRDGLNTVVPVVTKIVNEKWTRLSETSRAQVISTTTATTKTHK